MGDRELMEFYSWLTGGSREGEGVKVRGTTWRSHMIKLGFMGGGGGCWMNGVGKDRSGEEANIGVR
jgi:hypothetical protein